jgi:hypothetical protein
LGADTSSKLAVRTRLDEGRGTLLKQQTDDANQAESTRYRIAQNGFKLREQVYN